MVREWFARNWFRIKLIGLLSLMGYVAEGLTAALLMAFFLLFIAWVGLMLDLWDKHRSSENASGRSEPRRSNEGRTVYVRAQEPDARALRLRIGGEMLIDAWTNSKVTKYNTYPKKALMEAIKHYDGTMHKVQEYQEEAKDVNGPIPGGWMTFDRERDLP